jgi:hypothetical protein
MGEPGRYSNSAMKSYSQKLALSYIEVREDILKVLIAIDAPYHSVPLTRRYVSKKPIAAGHPCRQKEGNIPRGARFSERARTISEHLPLSQRGCRRKEFETYLYRYQN